jgi:hypothetical protein
MLTNDNFDWSPLGEKFWKEAAESCQHKPSDLQLRFACLKHSGLNATDSARGAGYSANDDEGMRQQGSRAYKTTAVAELLSYAVAETGKGDSGIVDGKEARRILSRIARKGNNNERVKALEALARLDNQEREYLNNQPQESLEENLATIIALVPESGCGAFLAMSSFIHAGGFIGSFPFLAEVAPVLSRNFPGDWQRWRAKEKQQWVTDFIDKAAAGPLLEDAALTAAVRRKSSAKIKPNPTKEITDAD